MFVGVRTGFVVGFVSLCLSGKIVLTIRSRKRVLTDLEIKKESIGCPSTKESAVVGFGKADWHRLLLLSGKIVLTIRSRKRVLSDLEIKSIGCPSKKESIGW